MTAPTLGRPATDRTRAVLLTVLALAVAAVGLAWAKWFLYTDRVIGIADSGVYPDPWVAVRVALGLVLVVGISAVIDRLADRRASGGDLPAPAQRALTDATEADPPLTLAELPLRVLRSLLRLAVELTVLG